MIQALTVAGMFGLFFLGSLYLEKVLGYDPLEIGLAFLPTTLIMGVLSFRYTEPLITRFGARRALLTGLVLVAAGLALFTQAPVDGSYVTNVLPPLVLLGIGIGVSFPSLMTHRDVRRHPRGRRARLRARQHDRPGRRRARARGAGDPVHDPKQQPDRGRRSRPPRRSRAAITSPSSSEPSCSPRRSSSGSPCCSATESAAHAAGEPGEEQRAEGEPAYSESC